MLRLGLIILGSSLSMGIVWLRAGDDPYAEHVSRAGPRSPEEERKGFHLPPGFDIELVAAEPAVRKPINIAFDARSRLWVSGSVEYPFPAKDGTRARDTIRVLEDSHGDGVADKVTIFADDLNIPIGVLPVKDGAIGYSIPNVYHFHAVDAAGRSQARERILGTYGHKDTHGMTGEFVLGFDGWIYACHGFSNTSTVTAADGSSITMQSGNTYRFKPDGAHVEQFTHGQVNPFGLAFDPLGNLYSCDCHSRPIYMLLRGAYYPSFGKPHDGLDFGPEMMSHDHGSTAIAGITYYAADHFPPEYRDTIFVGNVVTNRINHDRLERHGSTYRAIQQPDFLRSDDPWFRPVDIKLGPDGALYVADFYNRIIGHYEVPLTHPGRDRERGRIWRIVYRGPDGKGKPQAPRRNWETASVAELVQDLAYPNLTVRMTAMHQLVGRNSSDVVPAVQALFGQPGVPFQRMHALWVLERLSALEDATLLQAAHDPDRGVRVHAMRVLAERRDLSPVFTSLLRESLKDADAFVERNAAEALGLHPRPENIKALLELRHRVPEDDTHLLHVVRMALREHLRPDAVWSRLPAMKLTERDARAIADVATGVPTAVAAGFLLGHLGPYPETAANQERYVSHVARYGAMDIEERLVEFARRSKPDDVNHQAALFRAVSQGFQARGATLGVGARDWGESLTRRLLASSNDALFTQGVDFGASLKIAPLRRHFLDLAGDRNTALARREALFSALMKLDAGACTSSAARSLNDANEPMHLRQKVAELLAGVGSAGAQEELLKALPLAPEKLAVVIAQGLSARGPAAEKLLSAVNSGKASARLLQDRIVGVRLDRAGFKDQVARLTQGLPKEDQRLEELMGRRRTGFQGAKTDPVSGAKVFEKSCATCHQLANKGAKIGPQLDGIGIRGLDRLLEDILDPNRNVDQAFRMTTIELKNGQIVNGLLLREEGQVFVLADSQGKEVRVAKDTVEERTLSQLSPMPANLVDQMGERDFYDLLAYLLAQKPAAGR